MSCGTYNTLAETNRKLAEINNERGEKYSASWLVLGGEVFVRMQQRIFNWTAEPEKEVLNSGPEGCRSIPGMWENNCRPRNGKALGISKKLNRSQRG